MEITRRQFGLAACALIGGDWQDSEAEAPKAAPAAGSPIDRLAWMAGHWTAQIGSAKKPSHIDEHWAKPRGGRLLATSQIYRGSRSLHQEFLQISIANKKTPVLEMRHGLDDDAPYYRYEAIRFEDREVVFENRKYRGERAYQIRYALDAKGSLRVEVIHRVEGEAGVPRSKRRVSRFVLNRVEK